MNDAMWQHHSSPWSGWTRSLTQPLLCLPLWHRSWKQGVMLAAWLAANPYVFPAPTHDRAWMTRAILGERLWVDEMTERVVQRRWPVGDPALWVSVVHAMLLNASLVAAWKRRLLPAAALNTAAVVFNLVYLDMVRTVYDQHADKPEA